MGKVVEFIRPNDLVIIESENEFVIRKGFLHINEIVIDKSGSSRTFVKLMEKFMEKNRIEINENDPTYDDFMQLTKFGLIDIGVNKEFLLIINKNYKDIAEKLCPESVNIKVIDELIDKDDVVTLTENKNALKLNELYSKYKYSFKEFNHVYYVDQFYNLVRIRAFNRLMNKLEIENTIGILDNENIYLTGIKPNYTGCYECLEKHIISKFPGTMNNYLNNYKNSYDVVSDNADISILMGMILKDMNNINKYGNSSLTGNVIHFYTPNFEYSYNVNRKSTSCSVCAKINNVKFEEQNIRSINAIKEALSE